MAGLVRRPTALPWSFGELFFQRRFGRAGRLARCGDEVHSEMEFAGGMVPAVVIQVATGLQGRGRCEFGGFRGVIRGRLWVTRVYHATRKNSCAKGSKACYFLNYKGFVVYFFFL